MKFARVIGGLALAMFMAAPASAQDPANDRISIFGHAGGMLPLRVLNKAENLEMVGGFTAGGGLTYRLHRNVVLRGDVTYAENDIENEGVDLGTSVTRIFYSGGLQFEVPNESNLTPYFIVGAGAVTFDPDVGSSQTRFQGNGGIGVRLLLGSESRFALFFESMSHVYEPAQTTADLGRLDRIQWDITYTGGIRINLF